MQHPLERCRPGELASLTRLLATWLFYTQSSASLPLHRIAAGSLQVRRHRPGSTVCLTTGGNTILISAVRYEYACSCRQAGLGTYGSAPGVEANAKSARDSISDDTLPRQVRTGRQAVESIVATLSWLLRRMRNHKEQGDREAGRRAP